MSTKRGRHRQGVTV